jgi:hypothetical protein
MSCQLGRLGPLDRSAGLLVGRTYLLRTVVSLVSGDPGVPRSPSMAARSLAGPTLGRPCRRADLKEASINNAKYPRIPDRILKGASHEEVCQR